MQAKLHSRPDLLLLLSLLLVILLSPAMDHSDWRRPVFAVLTFIPVALSTVMLWQIRVWMWPSVLLMLGGLVFLVASKIFRSQALDGIRWGFLAAFFALAAVGLFSYLRNSRLITQAHLFTAVNIYLLLGMLWAAIYCAMDAFYPGSIQLGSHPTDRQSELLYFSLITLSTVGYGDAVPVSGETRMLAALEGVTGVLYIAITVAILVSRFGRELSD
jgi:Ion channel